MTKRKYNKPENPNKVDNKTLLSKFFSQAILCFDDVDNTNPRLRKYDPDLYGDLMSEKEYYECREQDYLNKLAECKTDAWWKACFKELFTQYIQYLKGYNYDELSKEDLISLGFAEWSKSSDLMLAPYAFIYIFKKGQTVYSISGKKMSFDKKKMDKDTRFGYLAFGIVPKNGRIPKLVESEEK